MEIDDGFFEYRNGFIADENVQSSLVVGDKCIERPLVSIAIPTYKRPDLLRKAVESALAQKTDVSFEVVVVDNDSDSASASEVDTCIRSFEVSNLRLFRNNKNIGLYGNWNRCIQMSCGEWVSILNDDDLLDGNFISRCVEEIKKNPNISALSCKARILNDKISTTNRFPFYRSLARYVREIVERDRPGKISQLYIKDYFLNYHHFGSLGILFDRKKSIELGGFYSGFYPVSDYIFFIKLMMKHGMYHIKETLANYRIHANESIKFENVIQSSRLAYLVRNQLTEYIGICPSIAYTYSRLYAASTITSISLAMGADFDINQAIEKSGFKSRFVYFRLLFYYLLINFLLYLQVWKNKFMVNPLLNSDR